MKEVKLDGKTASVVFLTLIRIRFTLQYRSGGEGVTVVGVCAMHGGGGVRSVTRHSSMALVALRQSKVGRKR